MILHITRKELSTFISDRRFLILCVFALSITTLAGLGAWQQVLDADAIRADAVRIEQNTWLEQGEANPHDAAHFGRYALRPVPPLGAFDSGVFDFAGATVWMEAHFQNPPSIRVAENKLVSYPFASITPSWVLSVIVPLAIIVLLFGSIATERESGTIRVLVTHNAKAWQVLMGKGVATVAVSIVLSVVLIAIALVPALGQTTLEIEWPRVAVLIGLFLVGYMAIAGIALLVSTCARSSYQAFWVATLLWVLMAFCIPLVGAQIAQDAHPTPRARDFARAIQEEAQAPFWLGAKQYEEVAIYEAEILTKHRTVDRTSLDLNRDALVLQSHERFANRVYDRLYGELYDLHTKHEGVLRAFSAISPILALQRISRGICGTDTRSQLEFAVAAEEHRREIIEQLNEDMMYHAGNKSFEYVADRSLWQTVESFEFQQPSLKQVLKHYWVEIASLLAWFMTPFALACHLLGRQFRGELP